MNQEIVWEGWSGFVWLIIWRSDVFLWIHQLTSRSHKRRGFTWLADHRPFHTDESLPHGLYHAVLSTVTSFSAVLALFVGNLKANFGKCSVSQYRQPVPSASTVSQYRQPVPSASTASQYRQPVPPVQLPQHWSSDKC
jgi:hypothetical protein